MTNDKENAWFYGLGAADFQHKIRARVGNPFSKTIDGDELERVMPMLVAARPFFMFPESFSPTDIRDLLAAVRSAVPEEDGHIVVRITELFHPDMNYSDIEKAIRELLGLHASLRGATVGRPPWIGAMVDYCSVALWENRKTQLEKDTAEGGGVGTENATGRAPRGYRTTAVALWTLLDEIDTLGDSLKPSGPEGYREYYARASALAAVRHALLRSDGYTLRLPESFPIRGRSPDDPPAPAPGQVKFKDELERALKEPTLVKALSLAAVFENERAVAQALRGERDPLDGRLWDTCFEYCFDRVLAGWHQQGGIFPGTVVTAKTEEQKPVPMLLYCPMCHTKHIDEGEFATKPHHSHACQAFVEDNGKKRRCGHVWRPAIVPTVGIEALPGFINETQPRAAVAGARVRITYQGSYSGTEGFIECPDGDGSFLLRLQGVADLVRFRRDKFEVLG